MRLSTGINILHETNCHSDARLVCGWFHLNLKSMKWRNGNIFYPNWNIFPQQCSLHSGYWIVLWLVEPYLLCWCHQHNTREVKCYLLEAFCEWLWHNKWLPCMERIYSWFFVPAGWDAKYSCIAGEPVSHDQRNIGLARGSRSEQDLLVFVC